MKKKSGNREPHLYDKLKNYSCENFYPFHMPGHKRQLSLGPAVHFPNPYSLDITEIDGFDNLHHAEGIIRNSMEWAASVYGADKTYYLVNGSSGGILSTVSGTAGTSGTILMSRNCHKAVYHGVFLNRLKSRYVYPQFMPEYGVQCGLSPLDIEKMLKTYQDISAVFVVSPTYDGVVSDIRAMGEICHRHGVPLLVDEAHGAHFRYSEMFPVSALDLGADVVIQSVHKTLPCFTQSAILHIREGYVDRERIERFLQIYQSSSPSYVLMAGIEQGIRWMEGEGRERMREFSRELTDMRRELEGMRHLRLLGRDVVGTMDIFDLDASKIIVSTKGTNINGVQLCERLRRDYGLEMEMCTEDYVTAITTVMDTKEGLFRLRDGLMEIDGSLTENGGEDRRQENRKGDGKQEGERNGKDRGGEFWRDWELEQVMTIYEAWEREKEPIALEDCEGRVGGEFVYLYPPGIPILVPGERITREILNVIMRYRRLGLPVQGLKDRENRMMEVVRDGKIGCD